MGLSGVLEAIIGLVFIYFLVSVLCLLDIIVLKARQIDPARAATAGQMLTFDEVRAAALTCKQGGFQVADAILPLLDAAQGNLDVARKNLEAWYTGGMDRVSGWYKLHTRRVLLVVGLLVAVIFNVDTLSIVTQLSRSAELRKSLADAATQVVETKRFNGVEIQVNEGDVKIAQDDLKKFASGIMAYEKQGLPIGHSCLSPAEVGTDSRLKAVIGRCWLNIRATAAGDWLVKVLGWLVTGLAVSLGAPFWFDLLNRLVDLRGAGKRPDPTGEPAPAK